MSGHLGSGHDILDVLNVACREAEARKKREGFKFGVEYGEIRATFRGYTERRDLLLEEGRQEKIDDFYSELGAKVERAKQIEQDHPEVFDPGPTKLSTIYKTKIEPDSKRFCSDVPKKDKL